ncbi:MAG: S24/S26 family peptidase [Elusimicrobia bacterium]|nr:S24/S26 family peptidase [Elusimicrobiota bacterium]
MIRAIKLEGSSMLPLFKPGDIVFVEDRGQKSEVRGQNSDNSTLHSTPYPLASIPYTLRPGDCAVYDFGGRRLLHRVIAKEAGGLWFSDDAGRIKPHFAPWERVAGKALSGNPLKNGLIGLGYAKLRRFFDSFVKSPKW